MNNVVSGAISDLASPFSAVDGCNETGGLGAARMHSADHTVVEDENDTAVAYPRDMSVPALLAIQAASVPTRAAVVAGRSTLTYRELDAASNRLARYLRGRGIGGGALVGVCLDRSVDLVVALLGIMKSGAAYVPLDPGYPAYRLGQVIADAGLAAILTAIGPDGALPDGPVERILLDRQRRVVDSQSSLALDLAIPATDLAYVIFTSGSTGRPKGVRIPHRALVNLLCGMARKPGMTRDDVLVAVTTIAFDIAGLEIFLPLTVGASVVLADRATASDGQALAALLARSRATILQATPVTFRLLLEAGWRGPPITMLCGGEALPRPLAESLLATGGALWNMYGPTETTIWSSCSRVQADTGPVPIGPPMANTVFYVLDDDLRPAATGELFIGGDGVADGYLGRSDLTAERFLPDPFRPGQRVYRTGDLVRRREFGGLVFLGRADQQIKLRGYRIELGEIEDTLLDQAEIAEAAAIVARDANGAPEYILAHVVPHRGPGGYPDIAARTTLAGDLRARLAQRLPDYMQPAGIIVLDAMPLTPNGKLDRAALPRTKPAMPQSAPATGNAMRDRIAAIWCDTLGIATVGPDDDFFDLGGHSLLATAMLTAVEVAFARPVPLSLLFRSPRLDDFATAVQRGTVPATGHQLVEVQTSATGIPVFAINHTWLYGPLARQVGPDMPLYATQAFEADGVRSIEETAALHVGIIRAARPHGPYVLLGLCSAGYLAYEISQLLTEAGETVVLTVLVDAWTPDYLAHLPWLSAKLADWSFRAQMLAYDFRREGMHSFFDALRFAGRRIRTFAVKHTVGLPPLPDSPADDPVQALDAAARRYRPRALGSPLLVFFRESMPSGRFLDPKFGWERHAVRGLRMVSLPGDHFAMFRRPGVDLMAREILRSLEESGVASLQGQNTADQSAGSRQAPKVQAGSRMATAPT